MITIAVCSTNEIQLEIFKQNVSRTIGCHYEIITINNSKINKGICEVYNQLLLMAQYETVTYCHEDINFTTTNWGPPLVSLIKNNPEIGLVGVAGATYKSNYPTAWSQVLPEYFRNNILQINHLAQELTITNLSEGAYSLVEVIDGCFIAASKKILDSYKWNQAIFHGFHLYDMDISLRVGAAYKNVVANHIKVIHKSEGNFDAHWLKEAEIFCKIYRHQLPLYKRIQHQKEKRTLQYFSMLCYFNTLMKLKQPTKKIGALIAKAFLFFPGKPQNFGMLKAFIMRRAI